MKLVIPHTAPDGLRRRHTLAWVLGTIALTPTGVHAAAHGELGLQDPLRPAPPLPLVLHDGRSTTLPALLKGRWTALQLMFTGCSESCPIQGAVFAGVQELVLGRLPHAQLLSLSIDPQADDAPALAAWLARFHARPQWVAARPPVAHAEVMLDFVAGRTSAGDRHTAQVYLFDDQARLVYRMAEYASAKDVAEALMQLARRPRSAP